MAIYANHGQQAQTADPTLKVRKVDENPVNIPQTIHREQQTDASSVAQETRTPPQPGRRRSLMGLRRFLGVKRTFQELQMRLKSSAIIGAGRERCARRAREARAR